MTATKRFLQNANERNTYFNNAMNYQPFGELIKKIVKQMEDKEK